MAVLIDPPRWPAHGRAWSHLVSDASLDELHAFAGLLGVPARAFSGDHYDVPAERYADAVRAGALAVEGKDLLARLVASGLRVPKRRGERLLASRRVHDWLPHSGQAVLDLIASPLPVAAAAVVATHVIVRAGERVLVRPDAAGWRLPAADEVVDGAAGVLEPRGFHRLRLQGPGAAYRGPRPWAYVVYVTTARRVDATAVPGSSWLAVGDTARTPEAWPLVEHLHADRT